VKRFGLAGVLLALPLIALGAYGLCRGRTIAIVRAAKTAENGDRLLGHEHGEAAPVAAHHPRGEVQAKQAVDSFFVRLGDLAAAFVVFAGTAWVTLDANGLRSSISASSPCARPRGSARATEPAADVGNDGALKLGRNGAWGSTSSEENENAWNQTDGGRGPGGLLLALLSCPVLLRADPSPRRRASPDLQVARAAWLSSPTWPGRSPGTGG